MKEVTRISLAQLPYNIEVAAKKELEKYLHAVETSLGADSDAMREIESRVVEILADHGTSGERVITLENVETIKTQLGDPKEFISDEVAGELTQQTATEKRLMRDTHRAMLGGVCAGLGAYFHIDTVLVRLIFIVLVIVTSGAALLAYLIAWIVVPPARTAAERLQMAGKPVTLEALQEESVVVSADKSDSRIVLTMLRIMAGIASIVLGFSALMAMMLGGWRVWGSYQTLQAGYWIPVLAFSLGGVLFIILCGVVAHALFTAKATKKTAVTAGIIIAMGLVCGIVGAGGFTLVDGRDAARLAGNPQEKTIQLPADFASITSLHLNAQLGTEVQYTVTAEKPHAELRYSAMMGAAAPSIAFSISAGNQGEIQVNGQQCRETLTNCSLPATLVVYGPATT